MLQERDRPLATTGDREPPAPQRMLRAGETCWKTARADRFAMIVDAADYFAHAKKAMLKARHAIVLVGWDFDLRIRLTPEDDGEDGQMRLGDFLKKLVRRRRGLRIYILKWDVAVLYTMRWEIVPMILYDLVGTRRIQLRFDSTHPLTAAHHQKIAVIDDCLAFCGGIDMTDHRWDTRAHIEKDERRIDPEGNRYGPWHDCTAAVDGAAARALGDLARARWKTATGRNLPKIEAEADIWPEDLAPHLHDVDVGIARTFPAYEGREGIYEIEALTLEAIQSARHSIYIENQFFASTKVAQAVMARLREEDGPEVLVVNPQSAESWLEEETMDCARSLIVDRVRKADCYGRFRIYHPVNAAGTPIYVHSKVLVIDDRLLRVGSSNINNRSMGFDSECDLAVEGAESEPRTRSAIVNMRNGLLAEHLDVSPAAVAQAIADRGSLIAAVDSLRKDDGRSLRPLPLREVNGAEAALVDTNVADPERPAQPEKRIQHAVKRVVLRHPYVVVATAAAVLTVGGWAAQRIARR